MSTEHQQYSQQNQSFAIQNYAEAHGFQVVRTYSDAAKSGVVLRRRTGLRQLLQDVVGKDPGYETILVYDVSRWGRFQDTDEAAHYEFLCKSAGIPVHYCAEVFANDGSLPSLIMKALKRTMAGEYSRELGVKVLAGQKHLAHLGFKQGGAPGYGLRRLLVSPDRRAKQTLEFGERKSLATDRVILVPGPANEVKCVRDIFRMLVSERMSVYGIARELNRRGIPHVGRSQWDYQTVFGIVSHPKYAGFNVYGRTSSKLYTPSVRLPRSEWVITPGAFESLVDPSLFAEAQQVLQARTINRSDNELLEGLRGLLASSGRLSLKLIQTCAGIPSPSAYRQRFGSLRNAYALIGYGRAEQFGPVDLRRRTQAMREDLISRIAEMFPEEVSIIRRGGRWRSRLRLRNGVVVAVLVSRSVRVWKETVRWQIDPVGHERRCVTLLARLDKENLSFLDFHVLPNIDHQNRFHIQNTDGWLNRGLLLRHLTGFCSAVAEVYTKR
jgi:DNA invertase Pin-like site-specific DNA recombinase